MSSTPDPQLEPEFLLRMYRLGFFPMAPSRRSRKIFWCHPEVRAVLPLENFHIPHGLRRRLKKNPFLITFDQAFEKVIRACAEPRRYSQETWINAAIIRSYTRLHQLGWAHSVEAWLANPPPSRRRRLAGGLYGVAIGGAFFGESMFSRVSDASKVCLVYLVEHLRQRGFVLLDAQFPNPHLEQFGMQCLQRKEFLRRLQEAVRRPVQW